MVCNDIFLCACLLCLALDVKLHADRDIVLLIFISQFLVLHLMVSRLSTDDTCWMLEAVTILVRAWIWYYTDGL